MWRPKLYTKNPYPYQGYPAHKAGAEAQWEEASEAGVDTGINIMIGWLQGHEVITHHPLEGDPFDCYLVPVKDIPSVETE